MSHCVNSKSDEKPGRQGESNSASAVASMGAALVTDLRKKTKLERKLEGGKERTDMD